MRMRTAKGVVSVSIGILLLTACAGFPVNKIQVQSFEIKKPNAPLEEAISKLTGILVDRGFDIKLTNKEAGLVTTEYKKFASSGENPPFDYSMQIKGRVKVANGVTTVQLVPLVREQNRLNAAAFTEHELMYYTGEPANVRAIHSMREGGWRLQSQVMFMNIVSDTADAFGISKEDVVQNVTTTTVSAIGAED